MQVGDLLGRDLAQARLGALVDGVAERGAGALVVGDPGIGKTALVTAVAEQARADGLRVLRTSAVPSEAHIPFAGLGQLLQPVVDDLSGLPAGPRDALMAALGHLDRDVPDPVAVALAALGLLRDRAAEAPILVVAEDVHWLDRLTGDVLAFVSRRIETDPIVLLASTRELPTGGLADARWEEIVIEGLDEDSAATLVARHAPDLAPHLRARLLDEARGNPLALVELSIAWSRLPPGTLISSWVPLTDRLLASFASRVGALPPPCRALLLVAALDDGDERAEVVAAAGALVDTPVGDDDLRPAEEERLVEPGGHRVRFRHPLVRSAIRGSTDPAAQRDAHAALAAVVADPDRAAWHRAAATTAPDEAVAAALEAAADRAARRGGAVVAVTALERAAALSPDPATRGRRLVRAAECAADLGRPDVAGRLLDEAEPLPLDPVERARAAWRRKLLGDGVWRDVAQVREITAITDRMAAAGDVDGALDALVTVAVAGWWTNFDDDRRRLVVEAAERLPVTDDPRLLSVLAMAAPVDRGALVAARLRRLGSATDVEPMGLLLLGSAASTLAHHEQAADILDLAIPGLRRQGRLSNLSGALAARASAAWFLGTWDLLGAIATEALRLGDETERPANAASARTHLGALAACRGDGDEATALADEVEQFFRPLGAVPLLDLAANVRALVALAAGRPDDAYDRLAPVFALDQLGQSVPLKHNAIPTYLDAAAGSGHVAEARAVVEALAPLARRSGSPIMAAGVAYGRALLAEEGDAERLYAALLASDIARWPFLHARALLAHGAWLRRQRRVTEARVPLRAARDLFDGLGAVPWGERARQELRAAGEASAQRRVAVTEQLTAQELEIARLAASGLTNRQIGQRLFLSHRTIGSHLYHLFPKLGITSRTELAGVLAAGSEAGD
ncbi:MAG TPA: AAA family ATPase [Iamia sp.]